MTTLQLFILMSVVAASLFFWAGYFTARWRIGDVKGAPAPIVVRPEIRDEHKGERLRASGIRDYDGIVSRMAASDGVRSVSLADEQGLPIAGHGENQDGLAALSGVLLESAAKAKQLVRLGHVMRVHVETEAGTTVDAFPVAVGGNEIVLATLSVGPGPNESELRRVLLNERGTR
jgi:predicted regulator of Ras-like GTPase activity (Roadblock/LC7/MglB family)